MRTALGIFVFAFLAAFVALFLYSGRGEIREITATASTSDCIGDPKTPLCALDTYIACGTRSDPSLCAIAMFGSREALCDKRFPEECRVLNDYRRPLRDSHNPAYYRIVRMEASPAKADRIDVKVFYWRCKGAPSQNFSARAAEALRRGAGFARYLDYSAYTVWADSMNFVMRLLSRDPYQMMNDWIYPDPLRDRCWTARYGDIDKVDGAWRVMEGYGPEVDQLGHFDYWE
ncbi:MAG: hypothetical protein AB7M05_14955 [Alphaproteobacteria bacterium]